MNAPREQERLQPSLLDRLTDDAPAQRTEGPEHRYLSKTRLREAVIRDLAWLLNAVRPPVAPSGGPPIGPADDLIARSVLGYGLPPLSGTQLSKLDLTALEQEVHDTITAFEPRIVADTLEVTALRTDQMMAAHNLVEFEIRGMLWAQPVPLEMLLRTTIDLEAGLVDVMDARAGRPSGGRRS